MNNKNLALGSIIVVVLIVLAVFPSVVDAKVVSTNVTTKITQNISFKKLVNPPGWLFGLIMQFITGILLFIFSYLHL